MTIIHSLAIVTALGLCGTSASATTMQECRAKYKAAQTKSGVGLFWDDYQKKYCGIDATAPKPVPTAPVKN